MPLLRRLVTFSPALVALVGAAGCGFDVYRVHSYWGSAIRFDGMGSTYAWAPGGPAESGLAERPQLDPVLRKLIDKRLQHKAYRKVDALEYTGAAPRDTVQPVRQPADGAIEQATMDFPQPHADFLVRYRAGTMLRQAQVGSAAWEEGALAIDILDPDTGDVIWIGSAVARIDHAMPPDERERRLRSAVRRILRNFPSRQR